MFAVKKKPRVDKSKQRRDLLCDIIKFGSFCAAVRIVTMILNHEE